MREARKLYDALLRPIGETAQKDTLIIVPDGQLLLVPFDALRDVRRALCRGNSNGHLFAFRKQLLSFEGTEAPAGRRKSLLAVGGVPYAGSSLNRSVLTRGFNRSGFVDLPVFGGRSADSAGSISQREGGPAGGTIRN